MANTIRKIFAIILAVTLCVGMAPSALAAVITETEEEVDGGMTTVITTTTETTEDGNTTTVTVTVKTEKDGVDDDGAIVDYDETKVTTTKTTESDVDTVVTEKVVTDGTETKDYKDLDVEIGDKVPTGAVTAKPGEKQSEDFHGEFTETEGDTTTTNIVDRTVDLEVTEEMVTEMEDGTENLVSIMPDDYEGKKGTSYGSRDLGEMGTAPYTYGNYWDEYWEEASKVPQPNDSDYVYQFTGIHEIGQDPYRVNVWKVEYETDPETGKVIFDDEGKPVIKKKIAVNPSGNHSSGWDGAGYPTQVQSFILTKYGEEGEKDRYLTYCLDKNTLVADGHWYSISNLEDSDYYPDEKSAEHLRGIALNGYWATEEGLGSIPYIQEKMRAAYGEDETITVTDKNGKKQTYNIHELIDDLCEGEALGCTQAAIWSYSNGALDVQTGKNNVLVNDNFTYALTKNDDAEVGARSLARMRAMYYWLLDITEGKSEDTTTVINEKNFVDEVSLTVGEKVDEVTVVEDDVEKTNGVYETQLNFTLAFAPANNDDLIVCLKYYDFEGIEQTVVRRLSGAAAEGETYITQNADGSYTFEGLKLSENREFDFKLNLHGTQNLKQGVYVYAPYGGSTESQTMVGIASGSREVDVTAAMSISFSVEEKKDVHIERVWHEDNDPTIYILKEKDTEEIEEEEIPLDPVPYNLQPTPPAEKLDVPSETETILDEDVPLAAVPGLGDESYSWLMIAAFAGIGFVALNLPEKKREEN